MLGTPSCRSGSAGEARRSQPPVRAFFFPCLGVTCARKVSVTAVGSTPPQCQQAHKVVCGL